jgi:hypothetical protein
MKKAPAVDKHGRGAPSGNSIFSIFDILLIQYHNRQFRLGASDFFPHKK